MRNNIVWAVIATLLLPTSVLADVGVGPAPISQSPKKIQLKNVELSESGELVGQFVNRAGLPVGGQTLAIEQLDRKQVVQIANDGSFTVNGLASGTVVLRAGGESFACRVWKNGTAPPNSLQSIAIVSASQIVLGQAFIPTLLPLPPLPLPPIPLPAIPLLPGMPIITAVSGLGIGGVGLLTAGAVGIGVAVSQKNKSNASL